MLEALDAVDRAIFLFLNVTAANPVTDFVMPIVTSDNILRIAYGAALILLLWRGDARLRWLVVFSALTLIASDQASAQFLKPLFERPRPCHIMDNINLLVGCGGGFSMPSAHAANAMGQAFVFSMSVRKLTYKLYVVAGVIAVSRVFVGVHYPGDVIVGSAVGATAGIILAIAFSKFEKRVLRKSRSLPEDD